MLDQLGYIVCAARQFEREGSETVQNRRKGPTPVMETRYAKLKVFLNTRYAVRQSELQLNTFCVLIGWKTFPFILSLRVCVSCLHSLRRRPLITPTVVFMPQEEASSTHTIHEVELFQCPECESVFETAECLRIHLRTHSARKGPYGCLYCGMIFSCPPCLQDHLQSHVHVRVYRYQHHCCREVAFTCVDTLREHIELHTEGKCKCCDTRVAAVAASNETVPPYQNLPMTSRPASEGPSVCEQCGKTYDTPRHLKKHVHQVHTHRGSRHVPERPFPCLYCRKSFVRLSGLQMHTYNYHSAEHLSFCVFCERTFVQDSHYQLHAQRAHTGDKPYQCRVCGETFQESTSLQLHRSSHGDHSDDRVYRCGYCDKELIERHAFWMHLNFRHFEEAFVPPSLSLLTQSGEHSQENSNGHYAAEDMIVIPDDPPQSSITSAEQPLLSARSSRSPCTDADVDVDTDTGDMCIELLPSPELSVQSTSSSQLYVAQAPSIPAHGNQGAQLALHTLQSLMKLLEKSSYNRETRTQASTGDSIGYQTAMDFRESAINSLALSPPRQQGSNAPAVSHSSFSPGPLSHSSLSPGPLSRSSLSPGPLSHSSLSPRPLSRTSPAPPDPSNFITTQDNLSIEELCRLCAQPYRDPSNPLVPNGEETDNRPPTLRINWDAPLNPSQVQAYQQHQHFPGISR